MNKKMILGCLNLVLCMSIFTGCAGVNDTVAQSVGDSKGAANVQGKISISTYFEDAYLEEAAKKFMESHPDVQIEINTFSNPTDNVEVAGGGSMSELDDDPNTTFEKYLTQLNVEFMGGNAEDMLCLYGMPIYKYVDSGYLMDMTEFLKSDESMNDTDYYMNIVEAMKYKDGIYNMPLGYSMQLATVNEDYIKDVSLPESSVWQLDNMVEATEKVREKGNNCPMSMQSVLQEVNSLATCQLPPVQ